MFSVRIHDPDKILNLRQLKKFTKLYFFPKFIRLSILPFKASSNTKAKNEMREYVFVHV